MAIKANLKSKKVIIICVLLVIPLLIWFILLFDTYKEPRTNCHPMRERIVDRNETLCRLALGKWMGKGIYNYTDREQFTVDKGIYLDRGRYTVNKEYCKTYYIFLGMICEFF